jgi:hypothetical protein
MPSRVRQPACGCSVCTILFGQAASNRSGYTVPVSSGTRRSAITSLRSRQPNEIGYS